MWRYNQVVAKPPKHVEWEVAAGLGLRIIPVLDVDRAKAIVIEKEARRRTVLHARAGFSRNAVQEEARVRTNGKLIQHFLAACEVVAVSTATLRPTPNAIVGETTIAEREIHVIG
jgi:hypothetical protein